MSRIAELEEALARLGRELAETRELWSRVFHASSNIMAINSMRDGRFVDLNEACAAVGGYRREELLGRRMEEDRMLEDPGFHERMIRVLRAEGRVRNLETKIRTKAGDTRTVLFSADPVAIDDEPCILAVSVDITEREKEASALKESREYLTRIINCIGDPIFVKDSEHRFTLVNDALCAFAGMRREELIGKAGVPPAPAGSEVLAQSLREQEEEVLETGRESLTEDVFVDREGKSVTVMTKKSLLVDRKGNRQIVGVLRDITEYKRLEAQFLQAQKMEAVGVLAGGVAHDFNNLLNVINGYTDLALEEVARGEPLREELEHVRDAGKRAAALTSQLLAFGRKQILQPETFDLGPVIGEMRSLLRSMIREDIRLDFHAGPGTIHADPARVEQVVMNLVVNARDALPEGGTIRVETGRVEIGGAEEEGASPGPYVRLAVIDDGVGMDAKTRERIFEPFFTTKPERKGTGLGLSTVYGIVRQSGGFIRVASEMGKGTTVEVFFPPARDAEAPPDRESGPPEAAGGAETVLLAEDEGAMRALAGRVLRDGGYTVLEAADGMEALRLAREYAGEIQLVVSDVVMPGMGGRALVEQLCAIRPRIRALFISGYDDAAISRQGVLEPGVAFLQKPFTPHQLARKAREVLDRS
ncbi:MAG: PAS domain S-box protein [Acidobacteria bacterium]|nr:PAS domain S-box protein [Acidobacteriota bacterium]